ncbi:MAG: hypothetical protein ACNS60_04415 [Candidatus Cyclobacteriaceae bacterium M2_1C_046]
MKKLFIVIPFFLCFQAFSQKTGPKDDTVQKAKLLQADALISKDDVLLYYGNVSIQFSSLEASGADSVFYNRKAKSIEIYGAKRFTFDGYVILKNLKLQNKITYKPEDDYISLY